MAGRRGEAQQQHQSEQELELEMKLWPVGQVRPLRFHHTRHTTEFYGHLSPGYMRNAIDRLAFNESPAPPAR
jgi:hypothetical protein